MTARSDRGRSESNSQRALRPVFQNAIFYYELQAEARSRGVRGSWDAHEGTATEKKAEPSRYRLRRSACLRFVYLLSVVIIIVMTVVAAVSVMVTVAVMAVAPPPVLLLVVAIATVVIPMTAMRLVFPLEVISTFLAVPPMIIVAVVVVNARGAARNQHRGKQSCT